MTGVSDFLLLDTFLPGGKAALTLTDDVTLNLTHGSAGYSRAFNDPAPGGVMIEMSLWLSDAIHAAKIFVGDVGASNSSSGWELRLSHSALEILRISNSGSSKPAKRIVGTVPATMLASGLPVGAWNLLRLMLLPAECASSRPRETMSVFLNPTAHATNPTLGKVKPRVVMTEDTTRTGVGRRELSITPPAAGQGYFMVDYVSVLPA